MELFIPKRIESELISLRIPSDLLESVTQAAISADLSRNQMLNQCIAFAMRHISNTDAKITPNP